MFVCGCDRRQIGAIFSACAILVRMPELVLFRDKSCPDDVFKLVALSVYFIVLASYQICVCVCVCVRAHTHTHTHTYTQSQTNRVINAIEGIF